MVLALGQREQVVGFRFVGDGFHILRSRVCDSRDEVCHIAEAIFDICLSSLLHEVIHLKTSRIPGFTRGMIVPTETTNRCVAVLVIAGVLVDASYLD